MYRSAFVLLAIVATCACGTVIKPRVPVLDGRIVGGEDTSIERFPYQVSIRLFGSHRCSGSIVNKRVVITAARCLYSYVTPNSYKVQYGSTVDDGTNNVIAAQRVIRNENYEPYVFNNDVALLFLSSDIPFSPAAQPIELASVSPAPGTPAVVTGWANLGWDVVTTPSVLQEVAEHIVDSAVCQEQYSGVNEITETMLCAGGKDACEGDSGGPLVANGQLVGIVSWGTGCASPGFAAVYSNVANLRSWIDKYVSELGL